jgi:hypothetical protein
VVGILTVQSKQRSMKIDKIVCGKKVSKYLVSDIFLLHVFPRVTSGLKRKLHGQ